MRKVSRNRADDVLPSTTNGPIYIGRYVRQAPEKAATRVENKDDENGDVKKKEERKTSLGKEVPGKSLAKNIKQEKPVKVDKKDAKKEYEPEKIMDSKKVSGKLLYLIRWKGYDADHDSWKPATTLSCPELISKYNEEKDNSKTATTSTPKRVVKRKAVRRETKTAAKKIKTVWDSETADENAEYEVERILEVRNKRNGGKDFLIHWKGWASKFDSWEPERNLNCPDLIKSFMEKVEQAKTATTRNLRVAPETTNRFTLQDPTSGRRLSKRRRQSQRVRYDNAE